MEIKRELAQQLTWQASKFRVVTLLGPRQAGKTTLVKNCFPKHNYVNLEIPETRALATHDPKTFLQQNPAPAIYDEIQRVPELLSYIQAIVDNNAEEAGQFILTGSHQPLLQNKISQSLAGRTILLTLLPLSIDEIIADDASAKERSAAEYIYRGFLPEIYRVDLDPTVTYRSYLQTYVERDVRQIINVKDIAAFERFLRLLAARTGQLLNKNSLATDVGVDPKTIAEWISVLEASFIVFQLQPYFENFGKRMVKSPKIFFTDPGLASYLLGLNSPAAIEQNHLYGNLFENLVVGELMKHRFNQAHEPGLYFYRDSNGREVDVLWHSGTGVLPVEIKSSRTFRSYLLTNLHFFQKAFPEKSAKARLIFAGESQKIETAISALHFTDASKVFDNE